MDLPAQNDPILIVAGQGALPCIMADALGARAIVVALTGFANATTRKRAVAEVPLGHFGTMMDVGRAHGADRVLFIGGLSRPTASGLDLDEFTQRHLDLSALSQGDDAILRAISDLFAQGGLTTVGALDVIPDLAMPSNNLTQTQPTAEALSDLSRGRYVTRTLGELDVGQAVVVQQGLVLAVEGIEGTDALITRSAALARSGSAPILVKGAKPQQNMRLDIPTFGPNTVSHLAEAGFAGAFFETGRTLVVDRQTTVAAADAAGLFIAGYRA